jgi:hypothetical protein
MELELVGLRHQLIALAASGFIPPTGSVVLSKQGFGQSVPVESSDERKWVSVDGRAEARTRPLINNGIKNSSRANAH